MIRIPNQDMRLLWLKSNFLLNTKNEKIDVLQIIKDLGFIQIDSIQNVTRAQHHILRSRNNRYKEYMLDELLLEKGKIFEHFTHDASVLPVELYPMWKGHFQRIKEKIDKSKYYKDLLDENKIEEIINRFKKEGALQSLDFNSKLSGQKGLGLKSTYKTTLDYMWYSGILATAYRKKFRKYYDLSENIIPNNILNKKISEDQQTDYLCTKALSILGIANPKEIKNFWGSLNINEVNKWFRNNKEKSIEIEWENNEGNYIKSYATADIEKKINEIKKINKKIQIINPFDPAIRDRTRLKKIFNFEYKIEIFVPKEKRVRGYYVYPVLLGCDFIGRIEIQADRKIKQLNILNFWKEKGVVWNTEKQEKLDKELINFALLIDIKDIKWL